MSETDQQPHGALVLGIDPGSKAFGWALLRCTSGAAQYLDAGHAHDAACFRVYLDQFRPELVCIEEPGPIHGRGVSRRVVQARGNDLALTHRMFGDFAATLRERSIPFRPMRPAQWRKLLGVSTTSKRGMPCAKQIAAAVSRFVRDWPALSNEHARDAAAVAFAGWWQHELDRLTEPRIVPVSVAVSGSREVLAAIERGAA
jgi:Holliday junction resolvasome RuvABC endonuclease subunit